MLCALGALPLPFRRAIGRAMGWCFSHVPTHERHVASLQLQRFLGPSVSPNSIMRRMYAHLGETALESLNLRPLLAEPGRISCPQWDQVASWRASGRPIVALTAHTGNWDLLGAYIVHRGLPLTVVARSARSPTMQGLLERLRSRPGLTTLWRSDRSGVRSIVNTLTQGGIVAGLIDQDTRVASQLIPFFGSIARTPSSLVELGKRSHAIFVSAFIVREANGTFTVFLEQIDDSRSVAETLQCYHERLEEIIRRYPHQWVWFHKRWRTDNGGKRRSSREYLDWLRSA